MTRQPNPFGVRAAAGVLGLAMLATAGTSAVVLAGAAVLGDSSDVSAGSVRPGVGYGSRPIVLPAAEPPARTSGSGAGVSGPARGSERRPRSAAPPAPRAPDRSVPVVPPAAPAPQAPTPAPAPAEPPPAEQPKPPTVVAPPVAPPQMTPPLVVRSPTGSDEDTAAGEGGGEAPPTRNDDGDSDDGDSDDGDSDDGDSHRDRAEDGDREHGRKAERARREAKVETCSGDDDGGRKHHLGAARLVRQPPGQAATPQRGAHSRH